MLTLQICHRLKCHVRWLFQCVGLLVQVVGPIAIVYNNVVCKSAGVLAII